MSELGEQIHLVSAEPNLMVIVERKSHGRPTDYCVHGETKCLNCGRWCWLGDGTLKKVLEGKAQPWCQECAAPLVNLVNVIGHVKDNHHGAE